MGYVDVILRLKPATPSSETLVTACRATLPHIPEDRHRHAGSDAGSGAGVSRLWCSRGFWNPCSVPYCQEALFCCDACNACCLNRFLWAVHWRTLIPSSVTLLPFKRPRPPHTRKVYLFRHFLALLWTSDESTDNVTLFNETIVADDDDDDDDPCFGTLRKKVLKR